MKNLVLVLCLLTAVPAFAINGSKYAKKMKSKAATQTTKMDCSNDSSYPEVTRAEVAKAAETKSATIIDVNSEESFAKEHVPGAFHFASHESEFAKMLPANKNAEIIAYCGGVKCSAWKMAAKEACKLGYTNIKHFKGGIQEWTAGEAKS
jgi:rhodanese-related sulfurtransferase